VGGILSDHSVSIAEVIVSVRFAGLAALAFGMIILAPGVANAKQAAASPVKQALRERCLAAIAANDPGVKASTLNETMGMESGGGRYLFELKQADGARFVCQVCDEANPSINCGMLGLRLGYQPAGGETRDLPAELDRRCAYFLQKEVTRSPAVNHAVVQRIRIAPDHTDRNWLYMMALDEKDYRCVVRKSDGNFRVEAKTGDTWRPIATGILF
jgi:hypothetical protein